MRRSRPLLLAATVAAGGVMVACGGPPAASGVGATPSPPTTTTLFATVVPATVPLPSPLLHFDICESLPPLDVISEHLGEPVTDVRRLPRGSGVVICEAVTDGIGRAQFNRVERSTRDRAVALAAGFGAADEYIGPTGGFSYSYVASTLLGDTEWSVHVTNADTLRDRSRLTAAELSADLLRAWLSELQLGWPGAGTSQVLS